MVRVILTSWHWSKKKVDQKGNFLGKRKQVDFFATDGRNNVRSNKRLYADVTIDQGSYKNNFKFKYQSAIHMNLNLEEDELIKFETSYIGIVENPGLTYKMQDMFQFEG